jgi:hypothetical protein
MNKIICMIVVILNITFVEGSVINGDFQTGDLTGWDWTPTTFSEPNMRPMVDNYIFKVNPGTDINHFAINQEEGGILSQSINLYAGIEYKVSIDTVSISIQSVTQAHGGSIYLYIDDDLQWKWNVLDVIGQGSVISNSYEGVYSSEYSGQHDLKIYFMRTYRNSDNSPIVYHYLDDVSVTALIDTNDDGFIDVLDYDNFKAQFGGLPGEYSSDFNNDGIVDLKDFAILRDSYPNPEPSTIVILFGGIIFLKRKKK